MELDDSPYWTKQRQEIVRWLEDRAPSFTAGYVAAVRLLHIPSFPARVHLICHLVRDIYRHLPATLGTKSLPRPAEVFPSMVKKLADQWKRFPPKETPPTGEAGLDTDVLVSAQAFSAILGILEKNTEIGNQPTVGSQLAVSLFHAVDRREDEYIPPWIIKSFDEEYGFFVQRAHLARKLDQVPTDDGLPGHFEAFERALHSLVGPYFSGKEELDDILQDTNPATD